MRPSIAERLERAAAFRARIIDTMTVDELREYVTGVAAMSPLSDDNVKRSALSAAALGNYDLDAIPSGDDLIRDRCSARGI